MAEGKKIAVGLLGAGYIADFHATAVQLFPAAELKAVCDLNQRLAEQLAQAKGIPHVYTDLSTMLSSTPLDVVHVLTPPNLHFKTAAPVLEAGVDVFIEKPLCHTVADCQALRQLATDRNRIIGVSHNFLYFPAYEQLVTDIRSGRLGRIDQVDIVWNKELGQLKGGPFGAWMLQTPKNILFEVAPHSFVHVVHLLGMPDTIAVDVRDRVDLPRGLEFYRRWEIRGWKGNTSIRLRFSFIDGYSEHYIHVRGTNGVGHVDFENNTYTRQEHTPYPLDVDRYLNVTTMAKDASRQARETLTNVVLSKMKLSKIAGPFSYSITRATESFYTNWGRVLDERVSPELGEQAIVLAEWIAQETHLPIVEKPTPVSDAIAPSAPPSTVLVIGGTGFIGKALVKRLRQEGHGVRILVRDPSSCPADLRQLGVELTKGDFTNAESVDAALNGIQYVYHLARGYGKTWPEFLRFDVEPTRMVGELCIKHGVKRLFYASSIAIYYAGSGVPPITEATKPHPGLLRAAPYARSKAENENVLRQLHKNKGLSVVIFRPGIVLGAGGDPHHWGVCAWPYNSVCRLWGSGNHPLPIVLVDDVADAMVKALTIPGIDGQSYNLTSPTTITANDYLDEFERKAGIKLKRIPTPSWRNYLEALVKWVIKSIGRDPNATTPSYADWEGRSFAARFDSSKAERELGWTPVKDRDTLIREGIHKPVLEVFESLS